MPRPTWLSLRTASRLRCAASPPPSAVAA